MSSVGDQKKKNTVLSSLQSCDKKKRSIAILKTPTVRLELSILAVRTAIMAVTYSNHQSNKDILKLAGFIQQANAKLVSAGSLFRFGTVHACFTLPLIFTPTIRRKTGQFFSPHSF